MKISGQEDFKPKESHYVQIGITIRFGNRMWKEVAGTILTCTGDNMPTLVMRGVRRKKKKSKEELNR